MSKRVASSSGFRWRDTSGSAASRFWDKATGEKLDKDRFRRDLGGVEDAYQEAARRICSAAA